ncbi:MAG: hypothetical protein ABSB35_41400, partial [Bryobacteraceae bacterium]
DVCERAMKFACPDFAAVRTDRLDGVSYSDTIDHQPFLHYDFKIRIATLQIIIHFVGLQMLFGQNPLHGGFGGQGQARMPGSAGVSSDIVRSARGAQGHRPVPQLAR